MRKRVRLHQVRIGMFVEEVEAEDCSLCQAVGMISSPSDIDRLMAKRVISVVIDTRKGCSTGVGARICDFFDSERFDAGLRENYSDEQVSLARDAILRARPHARKMFAAACGQGIFDLEDARSAVDQVMAETVANTGALIAVARLKTKDEGTFLHSLSVSALMVAFGRRLGLDEEALRPIGLGGMVHDLGKTALPLDLLTKAGKLTVEERHLIQTHPRHGYEMVRKIVGMPKTVLDICLYHHEKHDGSGYPKRLKGNDIPLVARIAAICDVYDALTSLRPYKRAWSQAEAIDRMLHSPGHFDPDLLKTFIAKMVASGTLH